MDYGPWGRKELDMAEQPTHTSLSHIKPEHLNSVKIKIVAHSVEHGLSFGTGHM